MLEEFLSPHMRGALIAIIVIVAIAFAAIVLFLAEWMWESWQERHVSMIDWTKGKGEGDEHP